MRMIINTVAPTILEVQLIDQGIFLLKNLVGDIFESYDSDMIFKTNTQIEPFNITLTPSYHLMDNEVLHNKLKETIREFRKINHLSTEDLSLVGNVIRYYPPELRAIYEKDKPFID